MGATTRHTCRLFICLALVITCLPGGASASAPEAPQSQPDILVSIVMHNEEPRMGHYPDFVNDEVAFWQHRAALIQFVDMLDANGVMFNWQSDWNFLLAVGLYDTGTPETNGKNLVRYIKEDLGFEVDPHAHETLYNYADVACLIEALGVTVSNTAGGFLAAPPEDSKLEYLWQPITGTQYPTYTWQAEILWGGATLFHIDEQSLWVSGVWKPKDKFHFLEHDDATPLPYVGGYGRNNCDVLIEKQQNGELEEENIHTCTLFVGQTELLRPGFVQQFEQQIQALDTAGNIRWVGLAEVIDIWKAEYGEMPNILRYSNESIGNLVVNGGFEEGSGGELLGWTTFGPSPPGATFAWDNSSSHDGDYSVRIDAAGTEIGMWQQLVDVTPETIYSLSGYVAFESVFPPGYSNLEVVFRDSEGHVLQFVDLPEHDGTRPFELDFPYDLKFRAPADAVTAEVNCFLQGPGTVWFDDIFFGCAPVGTISGTVTSGGQPLQGVRVYLWGDPWDEVYEDHADEMGRYVLEDVPVAFPRYVMLAEKDGYKTKPTGDVEVLADGTTTVNFDLVPGTDPVDDLQVKYGCLELNYSEEPYQVPGNAIIPSDPGGYPDSVREYLKSDQYITSDDPEIVALAHEILDSVPEEDRSSTYEVAWAVYEWVVKNINHDAVFGDKDQPYCDVTSGIYQTIWGDGWCWGENFYDWAYTPTETLAAGCAICVEHSWLASALLRALNIPARARVGSAQFWVQKPSEYGYWVGLSTNGGSNAYREHGNLGTGFGGSAFPSYFSVTSEPFLHEDWDMWNKCLWRERHPWGESYPATQQGLDQALADMDVFEATSDAPRGTHVAPGADRYQINYSDITVNLYNMGSQHVLDVRFPMISESDTHHDMGSQAYWTNHPECVTRTWIEEIANPPVEGVQRWYHIEFDLTGLLDSDPIPYLDSPFGFHPASVAKPGYLDNGYVDAANIGVKWTREGVYAFWFIVQSDLEQPAYDFTLYDRQWGDIPTDMCILANIAPQGGRIDEGRCLPGSWLPVDEAQYTAFVTATVERYDGDGIDDMPDLVNPIKYWQVGNEPNDQRQSDFADLQRMTYQAIKQACPECAVLIGGATGFPAGYAASFDAEYAPILAELGGQYVDVFDFHWYGTASSEYRLRDTASGQDVLSHILATLSSNGFPADLPIWITEMGSYSGDPARSPFQTERQQAGDYFKRFIYPLSRGVEKVFPAFGLMEGFKHDNGYFDHTGLIYDGSEDADDLGLGVKKLAYYTYKKVTEKLEGSDWSTLTILHDGSEDDHLYRFRVEKDGQPIHIAWWDHFDEPSYTAGDTKAITLTGLTSMVVTVTTAVPFADTGQEVTDYSTAFAVMTYLVSEGAVTILLGENPVLVEEGDGVLHFVHLPSILK